MVHAIPGGHVRIHGPLPQAMLKSEVHVVSRLPLEVMWMSDALATERGQMTLQMTYATAAGNISV